LSLISNEAEFLNENFIAEINKKYCNLDDYIEIAKSIEFFKMNKFNLKVSISNIDNAFKLKFKFPEPVGFVINTRVEECYDFIFKFIFKLLTLNKVVTRVYSVLKNSKMANFKLKRIFIILFQAYKLLDSYQTFFLYEIIENNYTGFINKFESSVDIYEIIEQQIIFLDYIISAINSKIVTGFDKIYYNFAKIHLKVNMRFILDILSR
jgi:hypothetical protein